MKPNFKTFLVLLLMFGATGLRAQDSSIADWDTFENRDGVTFKGFNRKTGEYFSVKKLGERVGGVDLKLLALHLNTEGSPSPTERNSQLENHQDAPKPPAEIASKKDWVGQVYKILGRPEISFILAEYYTEKTPRNLAIVGKHNGKTDVANESTRIMGTGLISGIGVEHNFINRHIFTRNKIGLYEQYRYTKGKSKFDQNSYAVWDTDHQIAVGGFGNNSAKRLYVGAGVRRINIREIHYEFPDGHSSEAYSKRYLSPYMRIEYRKTGWVSVGVNVGKQGFGISMIYSGLKLKR